MTPFLFALPWLFLLLFVVFVVKIPRELPVADAERAADVERDMEERRPDAAAGPVSVSVIVPARNEALNIVTCLESLAKTEHSDFEIIVVDDRSDDETADLASSVSPGRARSIQVIAGEEVPEGWLGKPWACHQASRLATGGLLLFTDADTTHGSQLLSRAIVALKEDGADLLTVAGRQLMESFWERLVQPHIFLMMLIRFPDFERIARNDRWRDAIANGQYLLFHRAAYEAIGGHEAVRDEVVEDLALAQHVKRAGLQLRVRSAEVDLETRMYRSLGELVEGWSKNIVMGGLQSFPPHLRPFVPAVSFLGGFGLWLAAPVVLVAWLFGWIGGGGVFVGPGLLTWALSVYAVSAALWSYFSHRMGVLAPYGLLYPLGAVVGSWIFLRSWVRGSTVEWKGRTYRVPRASERA